MSHPISLHVNGPIEEYLSQNEYELNSKDPAVDIEAPPDDVRQANVAARKKSQKRIGKWQNFAVYASMCSNVFLLAIKSVAFSQSNSIAILASVLDSSIDILAGMVLFLASRVRKNQDSTVFPIGKRRVSPIATLIFASVMAMAALQIVIEAVTILVSGFSGSSNHDITVNPLVVAVVVVTICLKFSLAILCTIIGKWQENTIISAYAQDHINDTLTNSVSIAGLLLAGEYPSLWYLDAIAAIAICSYIIFNWALTGYSLSITLMSRAADPEFIELIKGTALNHDKLITVSILNT